MQISKNDWTKYSARQEKLRTQAANEMKRWIEKNGTNNRNAMIDIAYALICKYGEAAAAEACEMYDAIAEFEAARTMPAEPAETADISEVAKMVNGTLLNSAAGLLAVRGVERLVKQAGADTMLKNAVRDEAEFAWIPASNACPYCLDIASEGWKRASKKTANGDHAEHIHASCSCEFAVRFNEKSNVAGYEPSKYKEELEAQSENEIRAEQRKENRTLINAQKRDAYAFNKENGEA